MASVKLSISVESETWKAVTTHFAGAKSSHIVQKALEALIEKEGIETYESVLVPASMKQQVEALLKGEK